MNTSTIVSKTMAGVNRLCAEFRKTPHAAYLESSLHARLYYILALKGIDRLYGTRSGYLMRGVQREYPTIEKEPGKSRRGQLDLAVFDPKTVASIDWWKHSEKDTSSEGKPIAPMVAIEMGLNKGLAGGRTLYKKKELGDAEKELQRLANHKNGIGRGLLLYFYRYEEDEHAHRAESLNAVLGEIRRWAERETRANSRVTARIVCVRTVFSGGYAPEETYELRVERGRSIPKGISPRDILDRHG